jgi:hypothetical protein
LQSLQARFPSCGSAAKMYFGRFGRTKIRAKR